MLLGRMYLCGTGTPRNESLAAEWLRKAAQNGETEAQRILGDMYLKGQGVPRDCGMAEMVH